MPLVVQKMVPDGKVPKLGIRVMVLNDSIASPIASLVQTLQPSPEEQAKKLKFQFQVMTTEAGTNTMVSVAALM